MIPHVARVWLGMHRTLPTGRIEWLKDPEGGPLLRCLGPREFLSSVFASGVARRRRLRHCVALGEHGTVEVPEAEWAEFAEELRVLDASLREIDEEIRQAPALDGGPRAADAQAYDAMIANALQFVLAASRYAGQGYVVSIRAE